MAQHSKVVQVTLTLSVTGVTVHSWTNGWCWSQGHLLQSPGWSTGACNLILYLHYTAIIYHNSCATACLLIHGKNWWNWKSNSKGPLHQQTTVQCPHPMNDLLQKAMNKLHTSASEFYCVLRQLLLY